MSTCTPILPQVQQGDACRIDRRLQQIDPFLIICHDHAVLSLLCSTGGGGWWDAIGPLPAIALAWRGPLRVVDTSFSTANDSTPAVASWNASQAFAATGWSAGSPMENASIAATWTKTFILSNNQYAGEMLALGPGDNNYTIPAGAVAASPVTGAWNPVARWWPTASKVFDVASYGAVGDAKTDCTSAFQQAIDAAAALGAGATVYARAGGYLISKPLKLSGSAFTVEGSGAASYLIWQPNTKADPSLTTNSSLFEADDTMLHNVTLAQFWITKPSFAPLVRMKGSGSTAGRLLNIERVICTRNDSVGVLLDGIGKHDVVNAGMLGCTMNVVDSAGTVFVGFHEGGQLRVSAPTGVRSRFVGSQYMGCSQGALIILSAVGLSARNDCTADGITWFVCVCFVWCVFRLVACVCRCVQHHCRKQLLLGHGQHVHGIHHPELPPVRRTQRPTGTRDAQRCERGADPSFV